MRSAFILIATLILSLSLSKSGLASDFAPTHDQLVCQSSCQFWDDFKRECMYRTSCVIEGNQFTYTSCQEWDDFNRSCRFEAVTRRQLSFPPWGGTPACTESCQFADFRGTCKYRTRCDFDEHCARLTDCEYWDDFKLQCMSERSVLFCQI
jgi:hypothetical protein